MRSDRLPEDPSILDDLANKSVGSEEETVPLSEVQRRLVAEPRKRGSVSSSTSKGNSINSSSGGRPLRPVVDLLGGADLSASPTTSTQHRNVVSSPGGHLSVEKSRSSPVTRSPAQKPPSTDLLGLDFDSSASVSSHKHNASVSSHVSTTSSSAPQASAAPATPTNNRVDLTKSILSLYSSTLMQAQQANPVPTQTNSNNTFASFQSNNFGGFTSVPQTTTATSSTTKPSVDLFFNFQSSAQKSNGLDSLSFLTGNLNLNPAPTTTSTNPPATKGMGNGFDGLFSTVSNTGTNWSSASPTVNINNIPSVTHNSWTTKESTAANTTTTTTNNNNNNNNSNGANNSSTWNLSAWDTKPATNTRPSWTSGNEGWGNTFSLNTQPTRFASTTTTTAADEEEDEWDDFKSTGPAAPAAAGGIKAMEDDIFGNVWK